jgi:hypothetical protein
MHRQDRPCDAEEGISRGLRLAERRPKSAARAFAFFLFILTAEPAWAVSPCVAAADAAQDYRTAGKLREARASLLVCSARSCNTVVRTDCEKWLKEVDEQTPSLVVRVIDARGRDVLGAHVTIDDDPITLDGTPVQVDPGQRLVRARARSGDVAEQKTLVALGEKARVLEVRFKVPLEEDGSKLADSGSLGSDPSGNRDRPSRRTGNPDVRGDSPPSASSTPVVPLVLAGVGVVALGAFGYFELSGQSGYTDLENGCYRTSSGCTDAEVDPVKRQFLGAGIALGVSVVALAAAAIVYFVGGGKR